MGGAAPAYGRRWQAVLAAALALTTAGSAQAALYTYRAPDGSWVFSDHALVDRQYQLVRKSEPRTHYPRNVKYRTLRRGDPAAYDPIILRMARAFGLEPALIKAVMHAESAFDRYATSHKGASGLMQLMPATAEQYGVRDIYDPVQNVRAGVNYLRDLMERFNNDMALVLAAYNAGENAVEQYRGVPPYSETRSYVVKVLTYRRRYAGEFD